MSSSQNIHTGPVRNNHLSMTDSTANIGSMPVSGMDRTAGHIDLEIVSSPTSGSSSDTLHDNEHSDDDHTRPDMSPLSAATLDLDDLRIDDDDISHSPKSATRFAHSFHRNFEPRSGPVSVYGRQLQNCRRRSFQSNLSHVQQSRSEGQRNARTWMSEEARAAQEFLVIRNSLRRLFKNADVAKWKVADHIAHREAMMASAAKKLAQQVRDREHETSLQISPISPQQQDMLRRYGLSGNFNQIGNYGRIIGEKTIWCKDWQNGKDEIAPWPCLAELKWEGDDRAKTGVGRYPPLPREQGPVGLPWNQLQMVEQYPLDQIARIPTMEDIYLPVDEIDEEVKYDLINKELEKAMDAYLES